MRLTKFTDYCLRVLMYVAAAPPGRRATVAEIAAAFRISSSHLTKVVHYLGQEGILKNVRGRGGGLELAKEAAEVNVGALVRAAAAATPFVECFDTETNRCVITPACRLRRALLTAVDAFYTVLNQYTLEDIAQNRQPLVRLLSLRHLHGEPSQ